MEGKEQSSLSRGQSIEDRLGTRRIITRNGMDSDNTDISIKKRVRNCNGQRDYICGCSKAYLSYPAIYTHVRNKHNGIFPIKSYFMKDGTKHKIKNRSDKSETETSSHQIETSPLNELKLLYKKHVPQRTPSLEVG